MQCTTKKWTEGGRFKKMTKIKDDLNELFWYKNHNCTNTRTVRIIFNCCNCFLYTNFPPCYYYWWNAYLSTFVFPSIQQMTHSTNWNIPAETPTGRRSDETKSSSIPTQRNRSRKSLPVMETLTSPRMLIPAEQGLTDVSEVPEGSDRFPKMSPPRVLSLQ